LTCALQSAGRSVDAVGLLCAPQFKGGEPGLLQVAVRLQKALVFLPEKELHRYQHLTITFSQHSIGHTGLQSTSESAALAGAATWLKGGSAVCLLGARSAAPGATCALATIHPSESECTS